MRIHTLVVLLCLISGPLNAQVASNEANVLVAVNGFHTALKTGDAIKAMALVADDAVFLEAGGMETRNEYEKNHLPGDIEFEKGVSTKRGPIRVVIVGDAAWVTCNSETTGTYQGRAVNSIGTELMVLSRGPAGWRIRAVHWSSRPR